jgi:hypothetical protein
MDTVTLFEAWRKDRQAQQGWGVAWFLANEFCRRFYASHGIVPHIIEKEGPGYYGIQLDYVSCAVNGEQSEPLGRLTMAGDVENWRTESPGSHGLELTQKCDDGMEADVLIRLAIHHMDIPAKPQKSHTNCRHKRWGQSYELLFSIATKLALRNDGKIGIGNPKSVDQDPRQNMTEHMGGFLFQYMDNMILLSGDGRFIKPQRPDNLWQRYMEGETSCQLALEIEGVLGLPGE